MRTLPLTNYGGGASDIRAVTQTLLDAAGADGGGEVVLPKGGTFLLTPVDDGSGVLVGLTLPDNVTLRIDGAITTPADIGNDRYQLVQAKDKVNVAIGGSGSITGDADGHTDQSVGPGGMLIALWGCDQPRIFGTIELSRAWGDGIYVRRGSGAASAPFDTGCRGLVVEATVVCSSNRRNGLSLVGCNGFDVKGTYRDQIGNEPEAGVDLEPSAPGTVADGVIDVECTGNHGGGLEIRHSSRITGRAVAHDNGEYGVLIKGSQDITLQAVVGDNGADVATATFDDVRVTGSDGVDVSIQTTGGTPGYGLKVQSSCTGVSYRHEGPGGANGKVRIVDGANATEGEERR